MNINKENPTRDNFKSKIPVPLSRLPNHLMNNAGRAPLETISKTNINGKLLKCLASNKDITDKQTNITFRRCTKQVITYSKFNKNWDNQVYKDNEVTCCSNTNTKSEYKDNEISAETSDKRIGINIDVSSIKNEIEEEIFDGKPNNHLVPSQNDETKDVAGISQNHLDVAPNVEIEDVDGDSRNSLDTSRNDNTEHAELELNNSLHVGKSNNVVTPATLIQHKGIKNIKKSLKRPHSRELQGISPEVNVELEIRVKRRLFDRLNDKLSSSDDSKTHTKCLSENYTNDIFQYLLSVENRPRGIPCISSVNRTCLINWLIKLNGENGNPAVIQAACWYLDSYLSTTAFPLGKLQVAAAACFWIAQKLLGPSYSATKLVLCGSCAFTADELRAMEMRVLNELRFPRQPVVPQEYITYIASWCSETEDKEIEMGATFLCLTAMMMDKMLYTEYPSVIAAASIKSTILLLKKIHLMSRLNMCPEYQKSLKKFRHFPFGSTFRSTVRTISSPAYEYNSLMKHYGTPPYRISQRMVEAVKQHNVTVRTHAQEEE